MSGYDGVLMTDGYQVYCSVVIQQSITHLCCWSHARHKFIEAKKAQPKGKTGKAIRAVNFIAKRYGVEEQSLNSDAVTRFRNR